MAAMASRLWLSQTFQHFNERGCGWICSHPGGYLPLAGEDAEDPRDAEKRMQDKQDQLESDAEKCLMDVYNSLNKCLDYIPQVWQLSACCLHSAPCWAVLTVSARDGKCQLTTNSSRTYATLAEAFLAMRHIRALS